MAEALWDGKDFAVIQMLLSGCRERGEPACRMNFAGIWELEVRTTADGWQDVPAGWLVRLEDGVITVTDGTDEKER